MNKKLLGYFIIIFVLLFIILFIIPEDIFIKDISKSEVTTKNSSEFPFIEYNTMKDNLLKKDYYIEYDILIGNNKYDDIDDEVDKNLVDLNYIFDLIKNINYQLDTYNETRMYSYKTKYDNKDIDIVIYTNLEQINRIVLSNEYYQYNIKIY